VTRTTPRYQYRVRWQRPRRPDDTSAGLVSYRALFETEAGARNKAERLVALDDDKHTYADEGGRTSFDFPDLVEPPLIERREVGPWQPVE